MAKLAFKRSDSGQRSGSLRTSAVFVKHTTLSDSTETSLEATEASLSQDLLSTAIHSRLESNEPEQTLRSISKGSLPSETNRPEVCLVERPKKSVSWSNIEINHHAVVLGDNPSVSSGPPVALGPKLLHMESIPVLEYEESRPPHREKFQMALPRMIREDMLKDEGYGRADFRLSELEIRKVKKHRKANASASLWEKLRAYHSKRPSI